MFYDVLVTLGTLVIFGLAAELVTRGTEKLESIAGQGFAGGVLLGFMAALPETIFVIIATIHGSTQIAIGTALGGNIILFTAGLGLIAMAYFAKWKREVVMKEDYHVEYGFLLFSTLMLFALLAYGRLDAITGTLMLLTYVVYVAYRYSKAHKDVMHHMSTTVGKRSITQGLLLMAIGIAVIAIFSDAFIGALSGIAGALSIPALWLALVITPIASDLEELLTAYRISTRARGGGSTAIVSFIGSKLQNNTVLIGLIGILSAEPVLLSSSTIAFATVIIVNLIALLVMRKGRLTYRDGIALSLIYAIAIIANLIIK